jgi:PPK2 family polyphosphate:nucleotide phosphotransferase
MKDLSYIVPFDGSFRVAGSACQPPNDAPSKRELKAALREQVEELQELQRRLYASDKHGVLLVFQAMDAAGKDGTIRKVLTGVNPAGCQVSSFKKPSAEELDHDFLWRTSRKLPERGRIGVFNRSYYEEVLVVRVHPEYLSGQQLPNLPSDPATLWNARYASIRAHEEHLARNGMVVLKFWLNVSHAEQGRRFLARIDEQEKNWKFSSGDVKERAHWESYMAAYEEALNETSRPWAPWYAIPADNKNYMRLQVAKIIVEKLKELNLAYPQLSEKELAEMQELRAVVAASIS